MFGARNNWFYVSLLRLASNFHINMLDHIPLVPCLDNSVLIYYLHLDLAPAKRKLDHHATVKEYSQNDFQTSSSVIGVCSNGRLCKVVMTWSARHCKETGSIGPEYC